MAATWRTSSTSRWRRSAIMRPAPAARSAGGEPARGCEDEPGGDRAMRIRAGADHPQPAGDDRRQQRQAAERSIRRADPRGRRAGDGGLRRTSRCEYRAGRGHLLGSVDPVQFQQVVINLIRNAVEAVRQSERREIAIASELEGGEVCIRIDDSGPGIAPGASRRPCSNPSSPPSPTGWESASRSAAPSSKRMAAGSRRPTAPVAAPRCG